MVPITKLNPGYPSIRKKVFGIATSEEIKTFFHLRLNIYPDGGIARLRAYGIAIPSPHLLSIRREINLISPLYNSYCILHNGAYIGHPNNIIQLNDATSMVDGWLTMRKYKQNIIFNQKLSFEQVYKTVSSTNYKITVKNFKNL